jgi:hypothetical protein
MDMIKYLKVVETWKSIVKLLYGVFAIKRNFLDSTIAIHAMF